MHSNLKIPRIPLFNRAIDDIGLNKSSFNLILPHFPPFVSIHLIKVNSLLNLFRRAGKPTYRLFKVFSTGVHSTMECVNFFSSFLVSIGGFPIEIEKQISKLITYIIANFIT